MVDSVYVPRAIEVSDQRMTLQLLRGAGAGHLVSITPDGLDATFLPFLVDDELTTVHAHLARANPHWRELDGADVLLAVAASDAYVSPSWYPSKLDDASVVPTWNYEVVHVHGTARIIDDTSFIEHVVRELTDLHESARTDADSCTPAWSVDDAPSDYINRMLRAIVGVEITVSSVGAKQKLSQNRSEQDRSGVARALASSERSALRTVADAMEELPADERRQK